MHTLPGNSALALARRLVLPALASTLLLIVILACEPGSGATGQTCGQSSPCNSDHFCLDSKCAEKKKGGLTCAQSGECSSGTCNNKVCACSKTEHCEANETCTGGACVNPCNLAPYAGAAVYVKAPTRGKKGEAFTFDIQAWGHSTGATWSSVSAVVENDHHSNEQYKPSLTYESKDGSERKYAVAVPYYGTYVIKARFAYKVSGFSTECAITGHATVDVLQ